ncbi:hypothetical protein GGR53DRAFT_164666 [Hypoxylon sp. FL1150]|nr:hypothetical protein GGR53DRAFT_164666 [Hypoxylon sp. FL1150]
MAFRDELVLAQSSPLTVDFKRENEQLIQREWLQLITRQDSPTIEPTKILHNYKMRELLLPLTPDEPPNTDHERQIQRIACRLSRKTLQQYLSVIPVHLPLPAGGGRLGILPQHIIDQICSNVPYEDLLMLYQQCREFHKIINPHLAPHPTKLSFVLRAERDFKQHWTQTPPNLGCYMCSRVLPAGLFASRQALHALLRPSPLAPPTTVYLRRFCVYCGIRHGCHHRGDALLMQTGAQYWVCECLLVYPEDVPGCADCRMFCPVKLRQADEMTARAAAYRMWEIMQQPYPGREQD